jgi:hypothetical protein
MASRTINLDTIGGGQLHALVASHLGTDPGTHSMGGCSNSTASLDALRTENRLLSEQGIMVFSPGDDGQWVSGHNLRDVLGN